MGTWLEGTLSIQNRCFSDMLASLLSLAPIIVTRLHAKIKVMFRTPLKIDTRI